MRSVPLGSNESSACSRETSAFTTTYCASARWRDGGKGGYLHGDKATAGKDKRQPAHWNDALPSPRALRPTFTEPTEIHMHSLLVPPSSSHILASASAVP